MTPFRPLDGGGQFLTVEHLEQPPDGRRGISLQLEMVRDDEGSLAESCKDCGLVGHSVTPRSLSRISFLVRSSFLFQMEAPRRLPLDTPQSPVSEVLLRRAIIDHMNRKLATTVPEHSKPSTASHPGHMRSCWIQSRVRSARLIPIVNLWKPMAGIPPHDLEMFDRSGPTQPAGYVLRRA
jgi:hypothetical protein